MGVIALRSLFLADPSVPLAEVMRTEFQNSASDERQNEVAQRIAEYNLLALPVMDETGDILGIITVDDAMETCCQKTGGNVCQDCSDRVLAGFTRITRI